MVLNTSKVQLFIKVVDVRDREKISLLLETNDGLTTYWETMKRVYNRLKKRHELNERV